MRKENN